MIRAVSAIALGFLVVVSVWFTPINMFNALLFLALALGAIEYVRMFFLDSFESSITFLSIVLMGVVMLRIGTVDGMIVLLVLSAIVFVISTSFMWRTKNLFGVANRIGLATFGVLYLGLLFPFWGFIRDMHDGRSFFLLIMVPACLCDTFAYAVGKAIGRKKFAPLISPNKTVEGFLGAFLGSLVGAFLIWKLLIPYISWWSVVGLSVIIWITSPIGDLVESTLKRSCGVKDSGTIIPGHGGVLDRLDALVFTAPAAFAYIKYVIGI